MRGGFLTRGLGPGEREYLARDESGRLVPSAGLTELVVDAGRRPVADGLLTGFHEALDSALKTYREEYAAYYASFAQPDSPKIRDANPTVVVLRREHCRGVLAPL